MTDKKNTTLKLNNIFSFEDIVKARTVNLNELKKTLKRLYNQGCIKSQFLIKNSIELTEKGMEYSLELTRRHRLWERYLMDRVDVDPMDVHGQAEKVEHILTEEQTKQIVQEISNNDIKDPHGNIIPVKLIKEKT